MKTFKKVMISISLSILGLGQANAKGAGSTGALTLMEPSTARSAALGEAFTAVNNDIGAFHYNPASLNSLESGQASFMYEKGLADDAYGHFLIGAPSKMGSFGLSVGYYNAGKFELTDEDLNIREVNAQTDMTASLGYSSHLGSMNWGFIGKYISSKLIDQYKATAFAADLGLQMAMTQRLNLGAAIQNVGTKMTYLSEGDSLPRKVSVGAAYLLIPGNYATTMLIDMPYYAVDKEVRPSLGVEVKVGPMAIRSGYKKTDGLGSNFTLGAGFLMGSSAVDYSFGMVDQLSAEHRISLSMKFGESIGSLANTPIVKKPVTVEKYASRSVESKPEVTFVQRQSLSSVDKKGSFSSKSRQVYQVRPGDTLGKIARQFYGDAREWKKIYAANRHLLDEAKSLEVGQKIVLP
jgi:LysM repeat protein